MISVPSSFFHDSLDPRCFAGTLFAGSPAFLACRIDSGAACIRVGHPERAGPPVRRVSGHNCQRDYNLYRLPKVRSAARRGAPTDSSRRQLRWLGILLMLDMRSCPQEILSRLPLQPRTRAHKDGGRGCREDLSARPGRCRSPTESQRPRRGSTCRGGSPLREPEKASFTVRTFPYFATKKTVGDDDDDGSKLSLMMRTIRGGSSAAGTS
jgi:hypothetical protein